MTDEDRADEIRELKSQMKYEQALYRNHMRHPIGDPDRIEPPGDDEDKGESDE